ncbi:MAG: hypothetical protein J2P48_06525 [Alphaproteobacteria bacterium]|nr:hypothetical protein [Alphaproteobacteria bacterium]
MTGLSTLSSPAALKAIGIITISSVAGCATITEGTGIDAVVDASTGANYEYPPQINVNLASAGSTASAAPSLPSTCSGCSVRTAAMYFSVIQRAALQIALSTS